MSRFQKVVSFLPHFPVPLFSWLLYPPEQHFSTSALSTFWTRMLVVGCLVAFLACTHQVPVSQIVTTKSVSGHFWDTQGMAQIFWRAKSPQLRTTFLEDNYWWASFVTQLVKNLPPMFKSAWVQSLGCEDPLEKRKATHPSILAWRISWTT